jgi:hypothetical protein
MTDGTGLSKSSECVVVVVAVVADAVVADVVVVSTVEAAERDEVAVGAFVVGVDDERGKAEVVLHQLN